MLIRVRNRCSDFNSYRAARVKSLFNAESACNFDFGALAFAKAWRRTAGCKAALLTPHYDVIDWLEPDWVFDTARNEFARGRGLWRRPRFELEIWQTDWRYWPEFEPHHYLKLPKMPASRCYVGAVEGERVCHLAMSSIWCGKGLEGRACRLVVK